MLCSPSALIQSICSQQIRRRLRPEQSSLVCRGILGREKKGPQGWREVPRAPAPGRALEAAASRGDPAAPSPMGLETPRHGRGRPLPALFGRSGALPLAAPCAGRCLQPRVTPGYFGR